MADIKMGPEEPSDYHSYLLRLWRDEEVNGSDRVRQKRVWRASLESPHTGERKGFADLEGLFDYLRGQTMHTGNVGGMNKRSTAE